MDLISLATELDDEAGFAFFGEIELFEDLGGDDIRLTVKPVSRDDGSRLRITLEAIDTLPEEAGADDS